MTQNEIDRLSIEKAKELFASRTVYDLEVGTTAGLQPIHRALFQTIETDDRNIFIHGIDQSYHYEGYEPRQL